MDKETRKKFQHRKMACEHIMKLFETKPTPSTSDLNSLNPPLQPLPPESRSLKIQKQLKQDKLLSLLATFESSLSLHAQTLSSKLHSLPPSSDTRIETTQRLIGELEKKLFESEKERIHLRRERESIEREIRMLQI